MSDKTDSNTISEDLEFNAALGWLAALSASIATWAFIAS